MTTIMSMMTTTMITISNLSLRTNTTISKKSLWKKKSHPRKDLQSNTMLRSLPGTSF